MEPYGTQNLTLFFQQRQKVLLKHCFQIQSLRSISSICYTFGNSTPFPQGYIREDIVLDQHTITGICFSHCTAQGMKIKVGNASDTGQLVFKCKISKKISSSINSKKKKKTGMIIKTLDILKTVIRQRDSWKDPRYGDKTAAVIYGSICISHKFPTSPSGFQTTTIPEPFLCTMPNLVFHNKFKILN